MDAKECSGAEGRWRSLIAAQERSGLGVAEFAARRGLSAATLYWWRSRIRRSERSEPQLVPIEIIAREPDRACAPSGHFEVELRGGRRVRVPPRFDASELTRLIAALERAC